MTDEIRVWESRGNWESRGWYYRIGLGQPVGPHPDKTAAERTARLADECHGYDLDGNPIDQSLAGIWVRLDSGDETPLTGFLDENEFDDTEIAELKALKVGEEWRCGGGAAPTFTVRRIA